MLLQSKHSLQIQATFEQNVWKWDRNRYHLQLPESSNDPRSLLVLQDSGIGAEIEILEVTSKVNRAYAKRWSSDYIKFTGISIGTQPWHSTYNKAWLLQHFIQSRANDDGLQTYDAILMLDSNSMIVDLDFDILKLIPDTSLLANGIEKNSDVMIWNLNHPDISKVADFWVQRSEENLGNKNMNSQTLLLEILNMKWSSALVSIPGALINGLLGTLIKEDTDNKNHVIEHSDLPKMIPTIQGIVDSVCYQFYPQCEVV